jgi:hypothetical protein
MFKSPSLSLDGDHLDLSFHRRDDWPKLPWESIRGVGMKIGDPRVGPSISLACVTPMESEPLDWEHTIDPMHFHGTDQFRLLLRGGWVTTRHPFAESEFGFQDSGWVYQEHPEGEQSWLVLAYGDRRGEAATLTLAQDRAALLSDGADNIAGAPVANDGREYPHPAGPKGLARIATTSGATERGHLWGSFADCATWPTVGTSQVFAGLWGDETAGPMVALVRAAAGTVAVPACSYHTEVLVAVSGGSCQIGTSTYGAGDLRVQREGSAMETIIAGPDGVEVTLLLGDRRAAADAVSPGDGSAWATWLGETYDRLRHGLTS